MLLFIQVYKHLHPTSVCPIEPTPTINDDLFFGRLMSSDDVMHSLLKKEFHMYQCLWVNLKDVENPLMWWVAHEVNSHMWLCSTIKSLELLAL